jgi:glycosyltransferase involved in cell wall biosynthesis
MEGKKRPLVSIITPSYNQGRFIEETIKSVQEQDYPNIEHIVVDGGSTDNTIDVLKRYEGRLRWVSEKDRGQSDAINKGFRMASGEIIAWLNSDDTYLPGAVGEAVGGFRSNPRAAMVYGKAYLTDGVGNIVSEYPTEAYDRRRLASFTFICQPSTFIRREAYFQVGGLDMDLHYTMDYDLWLRLAENSEFVYVPEFMSTYRLQLEAKSVSDLHRLGFAKEYLKTTMKYYKRAPANRVFVYSYHLVKKKSPRVLGRFRPIVVPVALLYCFFEYLRLNRGINVEDIRLINAENIKKLFGGWESTDILKKAKRP